MARRGLDPEQVVLAAAAVADADGLEAVTIARVAADLGVRAPSLYNHIDSREALVRGVGLLGTQELGEVMTAAAVGRSGADALGAMARACRHYARAHPGRYAAGISAPGPDEAERAAGGAATVQAMGAVLREWKLQGDDLIHAARSVRSAVHGFITLEAAGGFGYPTGVDASFEALIALLIAGLNEERAGR